MKLVKLWVVAGLALLAFGAIGTSMAMAAEDGEPAILCLTKGCAKEFKGTAETEATGIKSELITLGGKKLVASSGSLTLNGCTPEGVEEKDITLCKNQTIVFKGTEEPAKKAKCETEGAKEKGEAVVKLDLHIAAELNAAKTELEPLLLARVLTPKETFAEIELKCQGPFISLVKGTIGCLLTTNNGLNAGLKEIAAGQMLEALCKVSGNDPATGECEKLCAWLKEAPLEANLNGKFEDAWLVLHMLFVLPIPIYIDD